MKKIVTSLVIIGTLFLSAPSIKSVSAEGVKGESSTCTANTWTQKADLGAPNTGLGRVSATGFSIGTTGYIGTGVQDLFNGAFLKDFWAWDQATNTWTQKADFGGVARKDAVGFSIGDKGYIGTGYNYNTVGHFKDFWEYNPATNTWAQKADFGGAARGFAVGFSIDNKGYIGTGWGATISAYKDFWEYNPATNTWAQKADFGGAARRGATGFSMSASKGYIGTGIADGVRYKDFWEYNVSTNTWAKKADYPVANGSYTGIGFSIGDKGYLGTGGGSRFFQYDPGADTWTEKANFGGGARYNAVGFSIGDKGYAGTGDSMQDFWEYCGDEPEVCTPDSWRRVADLDEAPRSDSVGVANSSKGYVIGGAPSHFLAIALKDLWEYNPVTDTWTQKPDLPGLARTSSAGFSIGEKIYIGTGFTWEVSPTGSTSVKDLWAYDPTTETWTQKADLAGAIRFGTTGFSIGKKGYFAGGMDLPGMTPPSTAELWEYDSINNDWTQKPDFMSHILIEAAAFSIGGMGYVGTGTTYLTSTQLTESFWQYNPGTNTWTQKADFAGGARKEAVGFSIANKGYIGTGEGVFTGGAASDFWQYDPAINTWIKKADFGGGTRTYAAGFAIDNRGYIGMGTAKGSNVILSDFWEYCPDELME